MFYLYSIIIEMIKDDCVFEQGNIYPCIETFMQGKSSQNK
jgi:hypothetical protein